MNSKVIRIRPIEMEDTGYILRWRNNPRVFHNFIFDQVLTEEMHHNWMENKVKTGEVQQFIILEREKPIGSFYFRDIDKEHKSAEYGIFIGENSAVGKGYGSYIAQKAIEYAINVMGLQQIDLRVFEDNVVAIKSYEHAGFKRTGEREEVIKSGENRTVIFMRMEKKTYEKN
ncbi:UDP-4-amino-4,6-dideoxy-N-acetyl-beta-L-altrosamine N-acetyltransferase [Eubacterium sp.]